MQDIDWVTPSIIVGAGLLSGILLALLNRGGKKTAQVQVHRSSQLEDLRREKEKLIRAIREIQDTSAFRGEAEAAGELERLEQRAALVLKSLETLEGGGEMDPSDTAPAPSGEPVEPPPPPPPRMSPELRGMLKGGALVLFAGAMVIAVTRGSMERTEGMGMTGATPEVSTIARQAPLPKPGAPGGAVPDVPPALQPKPSDRVDRARARVGAQPEDPVAWAELGYALLDAEGWIDAYQTAQSLQELAPSDPNGYVLEAMVRVPMGQPAVAEGLLGKALDLDPGHVMARTARGMLHYSAGKREEAKADWVQARKVSGPDAQLDQLIAMAEGKGPVPGPVSAAPGAMPPGHPPTSGPASPPSSGLASKAAIQGSIALSPGAETPSRGVLFIYGRNPGQTTGPPVAVKRVGAPVLPLTFSLGPGDQMMPGIPFPEVLDLSARWDLDGNAMTRDPGDLLASQAGVSAGSKGLQLQLAPQ